MMQKQEIEILNRRTVEDPVPTKPRVRPLCIQRSSGVIIFYFILVEVAMAYHELSLSRLPLVRLAPFGT